MMDKTHTTECKFRVFCGAWLSLWMVSGGIAGFFVDSWFGSFVMFMGGYFAAWLSAVGLSFFCWVFTGHHPFEEVL